MLDVDKKGYYTKDELHNLMTNEGEPLTQEEFNEMLQACSEFIDPLSPPDQPHILYKSYIDKLVVEEAPSVKDK